jgi:CBS domain-containing protein
MGVQEVGTGDADRSARFMRRLLDDLRALERMIERGQIERGVRRIGAEQELVLVDERWDPAPCAVDVLARLDDPSITTEVARFNLECNLDPIVLEGDCFARTESALRAALERIADAAANEGARPILTGILPTLRLAHLGRDNITPRQRYYALDEAISAARRGKYEVYIKGADELTISHDSVMLEGLNTSFQVHYQVAPEEFATVYNIAQAIAAPTLAACVNSPILFGKRLWRETRIAIFQQVVDTRGDTPHGRDSVARVRFGERWIESSVLEIFHDDVARFRALLVPESVDEDSLAELEAGRAPKLRALQAFNSTVYRWNRACYGVTDGAPHLRIEGRILPAGPTILDEVANSALWIGLLSAGPSRWPNLTKRLRFDDAQDNFTRAARAGLDCQIAWLDGQSLPASRLLLDELLPAARDGLAQSGVDGADIERLLGVVEARVASGRTGAAWLLESAGAMRDQGTRGQRLAALVAATASRQDAGAPGHEWPPASIDECAGWRASHERVGQFMSTDLFTVRERDEVDLAASIMEWERVRHIPVEDDDQRLVGVVSFRRMLRALIERRGDAPVLVREVMTPQPVTCSSETSTLEAIRLMREHAVSCLPVVEEGRLVGIVTETDFMRIAGRMLESQLRDADAPDA